MDMRLLRRDEVELIWTIDRSEVHHHIYEVHGGQLVRRPSYFEVPGWRPGAPEKETPLLLDCFDRGGTFLGVFDTEALIGMGVLESERVGRATGGSASKLLFYRILPAGIGPAVRGIQNRQH